MLQTPTLFDQIKVLHLELTTRCQASCPQCARMDPDSGYTTDHDVTLELVKRTFPREFVLGLDKMFACGNFGDPAAARECLEIFRWFREVNPNITLGLNTNGALRDTRFWQNMGQLLSDELDYCVFSIDGMATTNDMYRQGVMWHRIMQNANAFITAGGRAHWDMLVFRHNQHQVDLCREHAAKLGFVRFRTKVSSRFQERPVKFLAPPKDFVPAVINGPVDCHAVREQSIYMAATGEILPCCFIGSEVFRMDQALKQLIADPVALAASWANNPHPVCTKFCATANKQTRFAGQFQEDTALC
jgi:hypothetical protein